MPYRWMADGVVLIHAGFVLFVVFGGLLALRWRRLALLHVPALLWGAWIELSGRVCPLTPVEIHWRRLAGEPGYSSGFIDHYVVPALYPAGLDRTAQVMLGIALLVLNIAIYVVWWRKRTRVSATT